MNNFHKSVLIVLLFSPITLSAQNCLPLYERLNETEFYLLRINSEMKNITVPFDTVSIILHDGKILYTTFTSFRTVTEAECCTHPDPKFLIGKLKLTDAARKDSAAVFILGKIDQAERFDLDRLPKIEDEQRWVNEQWKSPLTTIDIPEHSKNTFRWFATGESEKYFLQARVKNEFAEKYYDQVFKTDLSQCVTFHREELDVLYCTPDTSETKIGEPAWTMVYMKGDLVDAIRDFSVGTVDGYGPFHYQPQKLIGSYRADGIFYLLFSPGYVLMFRDGKWGETSREPVRFYGECDCG